MGKHLSSAPAALQTRPATQRKASKLILRFRKSERLMHWAIAVPFMICWLTAMVLINVYNDAPNRPLRGLFSWSHRISGVALIILPLLATIWSRRDWRVHLHNVKQAWIWSVQDIRWLFVTGLKMIFRKLELPEQGKFNAAEKLNFMTVMTAAPIFALSGILIWLPGVAFAPWLLHFYLGLIVTPLMMGHIFMATINPDTRVGLSGMFSGFVDREWAKHHYRSWYRHCFEGGRTRTVRATRTLPPKRELRDLDKLAPILVSSQGEMRATTDEHEQVPHRESELHP